MATTILNHLLSDGYGDGQIRVEMMGRTITGRVEKREQRQAYSPGSFPVAARIGPNEGLYPTNTSYQRATEINVRFMVDDDQLTQAQDEMMPENDIYLPKEELWTIKKHLDAIKGLQKDKQSELRKKARKNKDFELRIMSV